ncbi:MAG: DNA-3-methyladenine glycosylase I [Patescibacteria group bacterium]|nr:DNA-3-methyladenine glycosylase I [Patescibacteria group bacterium]
MAIPQKRCVWADGDDGLMREYHDTEWGAVLRDDKKIFEFLCLEAFQAGLSWRTILYKRKNFKKAFAGFDPVKISKFGKKDSERLMKDAGIVRNRLKIEATLHNAGKFLEVKKEFGTFSKYMWSFVGGKPIKNKIRTMKDIAPFNDEAVVWAKDLKKRGFKFLGPTTLYAHMQATGMVNDHMVGCFRRKK